jgi:hypothetical protein
VAGSIPSGVIPEDAVAQLVETLGYKLDGRGFDFQ